MSGSRASELTAHVRRFIAESVIGEEPAWLGSGRSVDERLPRKAAERGPLAPHLPPRWGGLGLGYVERADVFATAGYSPLGPMALNIAAPDEGNMHLLDVVATQDQQETYLRPLAAGRIRSAFAMTEPAPGAGSDPAALKTSARYRTAGGTSTAANGSSPGPTVRPSRS